MQGAQRRGRFRSGGAEEARPWVCSLGGGNGPLPKDFVPIVKRATALWDPGFRRWLVERRRIRPVIRALAHAHRSIVPMGWCRPGLGG